MDIFTSDGNRGFDSGNIEEWNSLLSTIKVRLKDYLNHIPNAINFLEKGICKACDAQKTAREINLIRDQLSQYKPTQAVYDYRFPDKEIPWINSISPIVTSCANLYMTSEGQDLLFELVSILAYASVVDVDVQIGNEN